MQVASKIASCDSANILYLNSAAKLKTATLPDYLFLITLEILANKVMAESEAIASPTKDQSKTKTLSFQLFLLKKSEPFKNILIILFRVHQHRKKVKDLLGLGRA